MNMTWEGYSWLFLRACGVGAQHLHLILQPLQHQLPRTGADFEHLMTILRRMGHVNEGSPGNIGSHFGGRGGDSCDDAGGSHWLIPVAAWTKKLRPLLLS